MISWHMDDLQLSQVNQDVLEGVLGQLHDEFGQIAPLVIHQGLIHDYLGMTLDFSTPSDHD